MATINGTPNGETLSGTSGDDSIFGQEGRDTIYGGDGKDYIDLGIGDRSGSQYADGGARDDTLLGGASSDQLFGNSGNDILYGGDGNDNLDGGADNDTIYAGAGDDYINVNEGSDTVYGGDGEDYFEYVSYNVGQSTLTGGSGVDTYRLFGYRAYGGDYYGSWGPDTVTDFQAGDHGDIIRLDQVVNFFTSWDGVVNPFTGGFLRLHAEDLDGDGQVDDVALQIDTDGATGGGSYITLLDLLNVEPGDFTVQNFTLYGDHPAWNPAGTGLTQTIGQAANNSYEYLLGSYDGDTLTGSNEGEALYGYGGSDTLFGLGGDDSLIGDTGDDTLYGGAGNDSLDGGAGTDQLYGGDGNDTVYGGQGNDGFYGGAGNDTVYDGQGANSYDLGDGNDYANVNGSGFANAADIYTGGAGRDQYDVSLYYASAGGAAPTIADFESGTGGDILRLTNSNYLAGLGERNPFTAGYLKLAAADVDGDGTADDVYLQADFDGTTGGANFVNVLGFLNKTVSSFGYVFQLDQDNQYFGPSGTGYVASSTFSAINLGGTRDADVLNASDYGANLYGGVGNDTLNGGRANDSLNGAQGDDTAFGGDGNDTFDMGDGDDKAYGGAGNDVFYGGTGTNQIYGGDGNDTAYVYYNGANNSIDMGAGNDVVDYVGYASGIDTITLGAGRDGVNAFARIFDDASVGVDVITDFTAGVNGDYVNLSNVVNYFQGWDTATNPFATGFLRLAAGDIDGDGTDDTLLQVDRSGTAGGADFTTILAFRDIAPTAFDAYNFLKPNSGGYASNAYSTNPAQFLDPTPTGANHAPTADAVTIVITQNSSTYYQPSIGWAKSLIDTDGDAITATVTTGPGVGTLTFNTDGSLNYSVGTTPGDYTFGYSLNDGHTTVNKTGTIHVLSDFNQNFDFDGGIGDDNIGGDSGVNVLHGNGGNDTIYGGDNGDTLYGDAGDDYIDGGNGADTIYGGDGADHLQGNGGTDTVYGGAGDDSFDDYFDGSDQYYGGDGNDSFQYVGYGLGNKSYTGGTGSDNFIIQIGNALAAGHTSTITDFTPGAGGDFLTLDQYTSAFSNFDYQSDNAFATGHLKLVQVGADTVLRGDQNGDGSGLVDLIIFKNATASDFAIDNIRINGASYGVGVDPHGATLNFTGTAFGDGIAGTSGSDVIHGDPDMTDTRGGDDNISGGWGADQIFGHAGNDTLDGNEGADSVYGGAGDDTIYGGGGNYADHLEGGSGNDNIGGNEGNDTILGGTGDDTLDGGGGNDTVDGGDGNDVFNDYIGNDTLFGGAGDDYFRYGLYATNAQRTITGGTGSDTYDLYGYYVGHGYSDSLTITDFKSGVGGDMLRLQDMSSLFTGWDTTTNPFTGGFLRFSAVDADADGTSDDTLLQYDIDGNANGHSWFTLATLLNVAPASIESANLGTTNFGQGAFWNPDGSSTVITGTDRPDNNGWASALIGTLGSDTLYGGGGGENISGLRGNDTLYGGEGGDNLAGNEGNDTLYGDNGDDYLDGNDGNDTVYGGQGNDTVYGGQGNDDLYGGAGDDYFSEYYGANTIYGGDGADTITTISYGSDVDHLSGGADRDTFSVYANGWYYGPGGSDKADIIVDFQSGAAGDILDLTNWSNGYFTGWDPNTNPFSTGYIRFKAVDADGDGKVDDIAVQADRDGTGNTYGFVDGVTLLNVKASDIVRSQVLFQNGHTWSQTGADGIPDTANDKYLTTEDAALVVAGPGVLANDSDPQSDPIQAVLETNPAHGSLTLNSDGSFTYTPHANFNGTDSFTYRADDGTSPGNLATVTIQVDPANDAPIANANSYSVKQDTVLSVADGNSDLLANDVDPDGDPLTAALVTDAAHGSVTINANGSFSYTPDTGYSGTDSFTYRANDGTANSTPATVTITVQSSNTAPVAVADSYSGTEDTVLTVTAANGVLGNDTDANGDTLTAELVSQASGGTVALNANGSFVFTPTANFSGQTSFQYRANDGHSVGNATTVTLNLAGVNDAPVSDADGPYAATRQTVLTVNAANGVLAGDSDVDGDALTAQLVSTTSHGTLSLNANGSFTYTSDEGFSGADSFVYRANDGTVNGNAVTVTINVADQNVAPVGTADAYSVGEDAVLTVNAANGVLKNDSDADADSLTVSVASNPAHGSLSLNANGSFTYVPTANFSGADSFTYTLNDGTVSSGAVIVNLTVNAQNDAPVSHADGPFKVLEGGTLAVTAANGVLANDTDPDSDVLGAKLVTTTAHGSLTLNANGSFSYTPNAGYAGADSFVYAAEDPSGALSVQQTIQINVVPPATFSIQAVDAVKFEGGTPTAETLVTPALAKFAAFSLLSNSAPSGTDDSYTVPHDSVLAVNAIDGVLTNDIDADGDTLTAGLVSGVSHGALSLNANGSFSYTPTAGFVGTDSFVYRANDGTDNSGNVHVTIQVTGSIPPGTPSTGGGWGDVHLNTFDGLNYDFQGVGEFVLVKGTSADDPEVQIRTKAYAGSNSVSVTQGIATEVNGTRITVDINRASPVYIDGVPAPLNAITPFTFQVARAGDSDTVQHVSYAVAGTGEHPANATDFAGGVLPSGTLTFNPGETTKTVTLLVNGDGTIEPDETFGVTLSNADNGSFIGTATASGTILDDDANPPAGGGSGSIGTLDLDLGNGASLTASLNNGQGQYVITYSNGDVFSFQTNGDSYGNVIYTNSDSHPTVGLLGSHDGDRTNDIVTVDGVELGTSPAASDLYGDFANGWRVTDGTTLFDYPAGKGTADYQDGNFPFHILSLSDFPTTIVQQALDAAAAAGITDPALQQNAALDLILGGPEFTQGYVAEVPLPADAAVAPVQDDGPQTPTFTAIAPFTAVAEGDSGTAAVTFTVVRTGDLTDAVDISYSVGGTVDAADFGGALPTGAIHFDAGSNQATVTLDIAGDTVVEADETLQLVLGNLPAGATSVGLAQAIVANDDAEGPPVDHRPTAVADTYDGTEDVTLVVNAVDGVLANDTDPDSDPLTARLVSTTSHGTLVFNDDGSFSYTAEANFNGTDSFVYHASDADNDSDDVTVTITVAGANDTPDAVDDGPFPTSNKTSLSTAAAVLLANDKDIDGDSLTLTSVQNASHGAVVLNNGIVTFTADAGYTGGASYSYTVSDGNGGVDSATVSLTVTAGVGSPLVDRTGTIDNSDPGDNSLTGTAGAETFFFDSKAGVTGKDQITQFGSNDVLVMTKKLADFNKDGIVTFGANKLLDLDSYDANGNTIALGDVAASKGLRYIGQSGDGFFSYASAAVRPKYAKEGLVSHDDILRGGAVDSSRDVFFADTALKANLGDDTILNFGTRDLLVTTTKLADPDLDGSVKFGAAGFQLEDGGSLHVRSIGGANIDELDLAAITTHGDVTYYVYGTPGATGLNTTLYYI